MSHTQNVTPQAIIPAYQRYVDIDEDIHQILSLQTLSLYIAFRFQASFGHDASRVKLTSKFMMQKAKISRGQYFKSLNHLEELGLIHRDPNSKIGDIGVIYVARHLYHFKPELKPKPSPVHEVHHPVHDMDSPVHDVDTLFINSFISKDNTNSNSQPIDRSKPRLSSKQDSNSILREMIEAYRETFPDNPQPHKTAISTSLEKTMRTLIKRWPELNDSRPPFTISGFRNYLDLLKSNAPGFSLNSYKTQSGRVKKNDLQTFCRWDTIVKFLEDSYS